MIGNLFQRNRLLKNECEGCNRIKLRSTEADKISAVSFALTSMLVISLLSSCTHEVRYRNVPLAQWHKLTPEQKQLIVDQAYEAEFNKK